MRVVAQHHSAAREQWSNRLILAGFVVRGVQAVVKEEIDLASKLRDAVNRRLDSTINEPFKVSTHEVA